MGVSFAIFDIMRVGVSHRHLSFLSDADQCILIPDDEEVQTGTFSNALTGWYFTLAHEIAHNLVQPHNSEHEFYFSAICEKHLAELGKMLGLGR
jgi:elongation factor P hydroxylase